MMMLMSIMAGRRLLVGAVLPKPLAIRLDQNAPSPQLPTADNPNKLEQCAVNAHIIRLAEIILMTVPAA